MTTRSSSPTVELPELAPGVTLVNIETNLGVTPVQTLLVDRLLATGADAYWVDGTGAARTTRLRELVPHRRHLNRVHIARGFTAYQHTSLIDRLSGRLDKPPAVILATGVDRLYRDGDIPTERGREMKVRVLASLARVARIHDVPVLITRVREDDFSAPLANAAVTHLQCRSTPFGPRFEDATGETQTLVYHAGDGWMQTTIAYWQEVLEHRARMHEVSTIDHAAGAAGGR